MSRRKMFLRMIAASLLRRRSRMIVALLSVAIGATILSGLVTIYYDIPRQMGAEFRNYGANMILTPTGDQISREEMEECTSLIEADDLVGAAPYRYETVRIHEQPVLAAGTDMADAEATSPYWSVEGKWPKKEGEILVGAGIAESLSLGIGESVTVCYTPDETETSTEDADADTESEDEVITDNEIDFVVSGILNTGGSEEDYVYVCTEDIEALTGEEGVIDLVELSINGSSEELDAYMDKINESVPAADARLVKKVTASETTVLSKLQGLVLLVTIVVLALTMVCVATTMTAVVTERRKEIGLRKAIGASDASIIREFMGEGILLGIIGGVIGTVLGFAFAQTVSIQVFSSPIAFRPALAPITIAVSVAITAIACLFPIRSATGVDPAIVLKGE